jgi:hypothetical protein
MKRMALLIALLMVTVVIATAQETPTFQVFGGYSYMNVGSSPHQKGFGLNGWNAQASWNLTNWLAATADFGGYYGSPSAVSVHNYTYLFGPTLSYRTQHVVPFAHALFGGGHVTGKVGGLTSTKNAFAMVVGGGLDLPIKGHFGVRVAQVDWLRSQYFGTSQNGVRVSTGVMFNF